MLLKNLYCHIGFLGTFILLFGCSKEQPDNNPKVVWQAHINTKTPMGCFKPLLYQNKVIVSVDSPKIAETLLFFDKNTGQFIQKWSDPLDNQKDGIEAGYKTYLYKEYLIFGVKNKTYIVNLNDATTKMKKSYTPFYGCMRDITGMGSKIFRVLCNGAYDDASEDYLTEYDIDTETYRTVLSEKGRNGYQTGMNNPTVNRNSIGDTMLTYANVFYNYVKKDSKPLLIRYNLSRKDTMPTIVLEPTNPWYGVSRNTLLEKEQIYLFVGEKLCCFNVVTGMLVWSKRFSTLFSSVTPIVVNNKLYVTNEDGFLYGLNANDGTELWKTKVSGTCSDPEYLNGVLYLVGGGDGLLHAIDANTGEHIYKFTCPDEAINSNFWWQRNVTIDPNTRRLYVASYGSLFCLEAVR
jgi:hypothetical protein